MKAVVVENKSRLGSVDVTLKIPTDRLSILELHKYLLKYYSTIRYSIYSMYSKSVCLIFTPIPFSSSNIVSHSCIIRLKNNYSLNYTEHDYTLESKTRLVTCNGIPVVDYLDFRTIDDTHDCNIFIKGQYAGVNSAIALIFDLTGLTKTELGLDNLAIKDIPTDGEVTEQDIVSTHIIGSRTTRYAVVVDKNGWICTPHMVDMSTGYAYWVSLKTNEHFVIHYTEKDGIRKDITELRICDYYKRYNNDPDERLGYRRTLDRDRGSEIISKFLQRYNIKHLNELTFK